MNKAEKKFLVEIKDNILIYYEFLYLLRIFKTEIVNIYYNNLLKSYFCIKKTFKFPTTIYFSYIVQTNIDF